MTVTYYDLYSFRLYIYADMYIKMMIYSLYIFELRHVQLKKN